MGVPPPRGLYVILALLYSIKKFFAKNQLLAQTPSDLRTLLWLDGKLHVELFALWHLHCRRKAVCFNTYIPALLIISLTFRSLGSLSNLIALLNQDQFLSSVRGHQAWIYNKNWPISRGGGYSHTLPIRICAAQRGRDFEAPDLERGIHFRGVF